MNRRTFLEKSAATVAAVAAAPLVPARYPGYVLIGCDPASSEPDRHAIIILKARQCGFSYRLGPLAPGQWVRVIDPSSPLTPLVYGTTREG